jgi:hypothetical protein
VPAAIQGNFRSAKDAAPAPGFKDPAPHNINPEDFCGLSVDVIDGAAGGLSETLEKSGRYLETPKGVVVDQISVGVDVELHDKLIELVLTTGGFDR